MSNLSFVSDTGDTFALDGEEGVQLVGMVEGLTTSPIELVIANRVGGDGGVLLNRRRPPQRVIVNVLLGEHVASTRLQQWGRFQAAAYAGGKFVFDGLAGAREMREVVFESSSRNMINEMSDRFSASFIALDPWWYGAAVSEDISIAAPTGWNSGAWNAAIPWNGGAAFVIEVEGDAPAYPVWTLHGELTALSVRKTSDELWTWSQTLDSASYGTVDHRAGSRSPRLGSLLNGVAESGFGLWFLVDEAASLNWGLEPGSNNVVIGASGTGGSTTLSVWYEPRYLTP